MARENMNTSDDSSDKKRNIQEIHEATDKFIEYIQQTDHFRRSHKSIHSLINWLLAISAATMLWLVTSFDKFIQLDKLPFRYLYFMGIFFCGLSVIDFLLIKFLFFIREVGMDLGLDGMGKVLSRVLDGLSEEKVKDQFETQLNIWVRAHNLISNNRPIIFIRDGLILYLLSLLITVIYMLIYFIRFL